jgi:D-3-phosphoglycerate dehydrogenase
MRVLVTETLSDDGMAYLRDHVDVDLRKGLSPQELLGVIGEYDGLIVRSRTQVTAEVIAAGRQLRVVGRAGTGVDNIDVDAATRQGVAVVNAPTGNSNAVAEHTVALMLTLARRVLPAVASIKEGRWEKSALEGIEVRGKCWAWWAWAASAHWWPPNAGPGDARVGLRPLRLRRAGRF